MSSSNSSYVLERGQSVSESRLWRWQLDAYRNAQLSHWGVTNNPFVALAYASLVFAFLRDWIRGTRDDEVRADQPIYILELGAGAGRFSYLFLNRLYALLETAPDLARHRFCLVMLDNVDGYSEFWRNHPQLARFLRDGTLDFANCDLGNGGTVRLTESGVTLTRANLVNPLIAICNYFFDQIPLDIFRVLNGRLEEGRMVISTDDTTFDETVIARDPQRMISLTYDLSFEPIADNGAKYPNDPYFDEILAAYREQLQSPVPFAMPVASLRIFDHFLKLSQGKLLLLIGDKGPIAADEFQSWECGAPIFSKQGYFSYNLNFDALRKYSKATGGHVLAPQRSTPPFMVVPCFWGFGPQATTHLQDAFRTYGITHTPSQYIELLGSMVEKDRQQQFSLRTYWQLLRISEHDPELLQVWNEDLLKQLTESSDLIRLQFLRTLDRVWQNLFVIGPNDQQSLTTIAQLYFIHQKIPQALECLQQALERTGESAALYFYRGQCQEAIGKTGAAQGSYRDALRIDPNHAGALRALRS